MISALLLSLAATAVSGVAVFFAVWLGERITSISDLVAAGAAGILIVVAVLHIGPEAAALNPSAPIFIALGLGLSWLVARVSRRMSHGADLVLLGGVAVHSFADGLILVAAGAAGTQFLMSSGSGLLMHELPEGVLCYLLARRAGFRAAHAAPIAVAAAGGTTLVGALLSAPFIAHLGNHGVGALLGVSTGLLVYSALSVILARPVERPAQRGAVAGVAGMTMAAIIMTLPSHNHAHAHAGGAVGGHTHGGRIGSSCLYAATEPAADSDCPDFSKRRPYRFEAAAAP